MFTIVYIGFNRIFMSDFFNFLFFALLLLQSLTTQAMTDNENSTALPKQTIYFKPINVLARTAYTLLITNNNTNDSYWVLDVIPNIKTIKLDQYGSEDDPASQVEIPKENLFRQLTEQGATIRYHNTITTPKFRPVK